MEKILLKFAVNNFVKLERRSFLWPITKNAGNPVSQSNLGLRHVQVANAKRGKTRRASESRLVLVLLLLIG